MAGERVLPEEELARRREVAAARVRASHDLMVAGVRDLVTGKDCAAYLRFAARFLSYSFNNSMLIFLQRPDATMVTGYRAWQQLGLQVRRGEKGIARSSPRSPAAAPTDKAPGRQVCMVGRQAHPPGRQVHPAG
ncbi:hypothetical protein GIS00_15960 [Nakamurella sp. YIM 132087]|uniref:N-terminal domain-containing protein n=1 Tax=Nakamurella alba TaxID=2665158 RepID=A0A7K1FQB0_9ACTN|nr:ArdC family protein [Nakamurella alba]MTD15433.1 hypothetical protein [Nakamurella alba]